MHRFSVAISAMILAPFILSVPPAFAQDSPGTADTIEEIVITAKRLNEARSGIQTRTGASTYTLDASAIGATPGGENTLLNQVIMQAPDVSQDSFGQFHVRGEHNGLQYRINGIILPEGINVFGQSLDPRLIASMSLITGALPAEYGLRTAGIIDISTKGGHVQPGGDLSVYGGSHQTLQPSADYGGSTGSLSYFVSGDFLRSDLGIESPDGRSDPIHDRTAQSHGFGYFEDILDSEDRLALMLGSSVARFEIPDQAGLQPTLGYVVNGASRFASEALNEHQREVTQFAALSWQHSSGALDMQTSLTARYSSLRFVPDFPGDLLFNGIAQNAFKQNVAYALQSDGAYHLNDEHTIRAGVFIQSDHSVSATASQVLPTSPDGTPISDVPVSIVDDSAKTEYLYSAYLQDEWHLLPALTVNYGIRLDRFTAFTSGQQISPRLNAVWQAASDTTVHAGYSRYLSPPPFELIGGKDLTLFQNTTASAATTLAGAPLAERANYYDLGIQQKLLPGLTVALDNYYKQSSNLIDEGQFGAPIILTPFNYRYGKQYGAELTVNYATRQLSTYLNLATQRALGKEIESAQFNFAPEDLAYIAHNYISLDHEQRLTASGGLSYLLGGTRMSADFLIGSGLRSSLALPAGITTAFGGTTIPNGDHLPYYTQVNVGASRVIALGDEHKLTLRFDVINVLDKEYEIRNGTGIGVGAPQYGARRGIFVGLSTSL